MYTQGVRMSNILEGGDFLTESRKEISLFFHKIKYSYTTNGQIVKKKQVR